MRYAILGDIHGNIQALQECMKLIQNKNIDKIIWCGDYITDFPGSHEVIQLIKQYSNKYESYIILGNRDINILNYLKGKEIDIKEKGNIEYTYKLLSEEDIQWLESLPKTVEISLDNGTKIYVSHKYNDNIIDNCQYMIFGHDHKQRYFTKNNITYINPGSAGIPTDGSIGAQFTILDIKNGSEKIEQYLVNYDMDLLIQELKKTPIYNDAVKWGQLLEIAVKTGYDYPLKCVMEYNKVLDEKQIADESLELWNKVLKKILSEKNEIN